MLSRSRSRFDLLIHILATLRRADGLPSLFMRLVLAPVFWMAGLSKFHNFEATVSWFGNPDWGLGLPLPWLMAILATASELIGAVLLTLGLFTRLVSIPLLITMTVAITTVHWENGWQTIADPKAPFANERVIASEEKIAKMRSLLQKHGNYDWLTSSGRVVILNNGIEFVALYWVMLLGLLFWGGGRYLSLDYWLWRQISNKGNLC